MSVNMTTSKGHSLGGISFSESLSLSADAEIAHDKSVPVAWAGLLGTRTSDTAGTITVTESAHLITTGARADLYWTGGCRRGIVVGTVAGESVPFTGGSGDNLPAEDTAITVALPEELDLTVVGDNVVAIFLYFAGLGQAVFCDGSNVEKMAQSVGAGQVWDWNNTNGVTNPLTGDTPTKVFVSHNVTTAAQTIRVGVAYNNA